jgi:hypothetical protein
LSLLATSPTFIDGGASMAYITYVREGDVRKRFLALLDLTTLDSVIVADMSRFEDYMFSLGLWDEPALTAQ